MVPFFLQEKRGGLLTPTLSDESRVIVERVTNSSQSDQKFSRLNVESLVSRNPPVRQTRTVDPPDS